MAGWAAPIAAVGLLVAILVWIGATLAPSRPGPRWAARVLFGIAVLGVLFLTLGLANPGGGGVNLVPFATISEQLRTLSPGMAVFNLLGNVLVLAPAAFLARPAWGWSWRTTGLAALAFSGAIEIAQGLTGRAGDIDDVLLNTLGAGLAAGLAAVLTPLVVRLAQSRRRSAVARDSA